MGFSLVAAFAVISVSLLISIEILSGSLIPMITDINDSYDDMVDRDVEGVQTDINITHVSTSFNVFSNYDHNITVENSGSITLTTSDFTLLINGTAQQFSCSDSYLYPEKETYFNISNLSGGGNKRLKVITYNGISDYYEYTT
jgi:archaellum component FlaF (FlaF/FlaG flagellin family)